MAVTDESVVDGIAFGNEGKTLIMEICDHLDFEGKFEWHVPGANTFDKWVAANKDKLLKSLFVKEVNVTKYGDLVITFNQNITLTVYVEVTNDTECWRFFEEGTDEKYDLVVLGNRIMGVGGDKS